RGWGRSAWRARPPVAAKSRVLVERLRLRRRGGGRLLGRLAMSLATRRLRRLHAVALGRRRHAAARAHVTRASRARGGATGRRVVVRPEANVHRHEQRLGVVRRVELLGAGSDRTTSLRTVVAVDVRHSASLVAQLLLKRKELDFRESSLSGSQGWASD